MRKYNHAGSTYLWNEVRWVDEAGMVPPVSVRKELDRQLQRERASADEAITDPDLMIETAKVAATAEQYQRAIKLAVKAWRADRRHEDRAAVLVSVLRKAHCSDEAVKVLRWIPKPTYVPLLTTLAAALADVERWEEAAKMIRVGLARSRQPPAGETFAVWHRIRKERPDLL
jgi:thioredoxin-like negative regulator of GroEL